MRRRTCRLQGSPRCMTLSGAGPKGLGGAKPAPPSDDPDFGLQACVLGCREGPAASRVRFIFRQGPATAQPWQGP